ncbi:MAG: hypothetical protein J6A01_12055 [Proteobacteria bacterium]|nr:hypothetical protein [Pseudomonadota bacterium]
MKKALMGLLIAGLAVSIAACSDDDKNPLKCKTPAIFTQMDGLNTAAAPADCKEKGEGISNYVETNKDALDAAFTEWSDDKQDNGLCYVRDALLYLDVYTKISKLNSDLKKCADDGSTEANSAMEKLGSVSFWNKMLDTATEEAKKDTGSN